MLLYLVRRVLLKIPTLFLISVLVFTIIEFISICVSLIWITTPVENFIPIIK